MESYSAGTLREYFSPADIGIYYQYHLGYLDLGPASKKDLATADVTKKEVGGICNLCSRIFVSLGYCTLHRCWLIFLQRLCCKRNPVDLHRQIYSHP